MNAKIIMDIFLRIAHEIAITIKLHLVQVLSTIGGITTFLFVQFPQEMTGEIFYRFVTGLASCVIYAIVGWYIKLKLDNWNKEKKGE
jgi:hypothetical protein